MSEWQPIETAPKDGTAILGVRRHEYLGGEPYVDGSVVMYEGGVCGGGWAYMGLVVVMVPDAHEPSHWMPLPDPPK